MLYEYLEPIIKSSQHGYVKGKSTTTNLIEMSQLILDASQHSQIDIIYFDFSEAFDQVRYDLLAEKLSRLSMPLNFLKVVMRFVVGREYVLKIDNIPTEAVIKPKSSVPQGSHFGPILYVIFTNDINISNISCYADNTKNFRIIKDMDDRNELQKNIRELETWAATNFLKLIKKKSYQVSYGKQKVDLCYFLQGSMIEKVSQVRDLGLIFDNQLTSNQLQDV